MTIVGVVGHIRHDRLDEDARPQIYFPFEQRAQDRMALVVRTRTIRRRSARRSPARFDRSIRSSRSTTRGRCGGRRSLARAALAADDAARGVRVDGGGARQHRRLRRDRVRRRPAAARVRHPPRARRAPRRNRAHVLRRGLVLFAAGAPLGLVAAAASARVLGSLLFKVSALRRRQLRRRHAPCSSSSRSPRAPSRPAAPPASIPSVALARRIDASCDGVRHRNKTSDTVGLVCLTPLQCLA